MEIIEFYISLLCYCVVDFIFICIVSVDGVFVCYVVMVEVFEEYFGVWLWWWEDLL